MTRVLIIHPEGNLNNNPNLEAITRLLGARGNSIEVRSPQGPFHSIAPHPNVCLTAQSPLRRKILQRLTESPSLSWWTKTLLWLVLFETPRPDLIIGIDRQGIVEASALGERYNIPYAYLSYEIFVTGECSIELKKLERRAAKNAAFAVAQDEMRARLLSEETGIPENQILRMPVAGTGVRPGHRTTTLNERLGIPLDKRIALSAGSVADWTMARELVQTLPDWPPNWVLVMHDRYGHVKSWLDAAQRQLPERLFLSRHPVATTFELEALLHSADLGIALYQPTYQDIYSGRNLKYIGMSSGKIATYLQHGLPIMINEIGEMADHVRRHNLGLVIREPGEIASNLAELDPEPSIDRCLKFFEEHLDAALYIDQLAAKIARAVPKDDEAL